MKNPITGDDLAKYLAEMSEITVVGDYGKGYHREVKYNAAFSEYRVYDHHEQVWSTTSAEEAAESFNAIRPQPY
jgi:hypothetical protein